MWSRAFLHCFHDFNEFKNAFKEQFWSETKQLQISLRLQSARYNEGSFTCYFMKQAGMARHLSQAYPEPLLVKTIARGLPPNISATLAGANTFSEAMERLRQADYYFQTDPAGRDAETGPEGPRRQSYQRSFRRDDNRERDGNRYGRGDRTGPRVQLIQAVSGEADTGDSRDVEKSGNEESAHL